MRICFITNRPLQRKFLILIVISMIIPLVLIGACLYYLIFTLMAEQLGIPEAIAINLFPVIKRINLFLVIGIPPILLVLLFWGAFLSHKFVGPIDRLKLEIEKMAQDGDFTKRLKVRKTDSIKCITDAINKLLDRIERDKS